MIRSCGFASCPEPQLSSRPPLPEARWPRRRLPRPARPLRRRPSRSGSSSRPGASSARSSPRPAPTGSAASQSYVVSRRRLGDRHRRHEGQRGDEATGSTATASSTSSASNISLFDGEITADSVAAHASASGGTRQAGGAFGGTSVSNLQALGRPHAFGRAGLGDWGYLVIARHTATRTSGFATQRLRRRLDRPRRPARDRPRRPARRNGDRGRLRRDLLGRQRRP